MGNQEQWKFRILCEQVPWGWTKFQVLSLSVSLTGQLWDPRKQPTLGASSQAHVTYWAKAWRTSFSRSDWNCAVHSSQFLLVSRCCPPSTRDRYSGGLQVKAWNELSLFKAIWWPVLTSTSLTQTSHLPKLGHCVCSRTPADPRQRLVLSDQCTTSVHCFRDIVMCLSPRWPLKQVLCQPHLVHSGLSGSGMMLLKRLP